jgi:hypothetical protein
MKLKDNTRRTLLILAGFVLPFVSALARADLLSFDDKGTHIDGGSMGTLTLEYPTLGKADGHTAYKAIAKSPSGSSATIQYDGGAVLDVRAGSDGIVTYSFTRVPPDVKDLKFNMLINFSYQQGGKWKMGDGVDNPFPVDKPANPHLFQDHASKFQLTNFEGKALNFLFPDFSYVQLQDNREWNWATYDLVLQIPFNKDNPTYHITVSSGASVPGEKPVALVDPFGQLKALDWPDKVKSEDELKADVATEKSYHW